MSTSTAPPPAHTSVIRLQITSLDDGKFLARSSDVPGLNAVADSVEATVELARNLTKELVDFWNEMGQPLPPALAEQELAPAFELTVAVEVTHGQ